jgi:S-adenosylmethionine synthetase
MTTTFMTSPKYFFTSESVTEGHPDKICDQISDAVLDAIFANDPVARVACECAVTTGLVLVMGEITTSTYVDLNALVRDVVWDIGYSRAKFGFDGETCGVLVSIKEQSADIALGVDKALEAKTGEMNEAEIEAIGAGDQGMMVGYACTETPELMPLPIMLAHKLCRRLTHVRKSEILPYLRPDGKSQVTVEYEHGKPKRIEAVVVSTQHSPDVEQAKIRDDMIQRVIKYVVPNGMMDDDTKIYVNPTGRLLCPLCGQEHRGRRSRRPRRTPSELCHRRGAPPLVGRGDLRHWQGAR